jgi:hypothetical protein
MTSRLPKYLAVLAAVAALGSVPGAYGSQRSDDPIVRAAQPAAAVAVAPTGATPAQNAHTIRHRHRARHGGAAVRRVDDNSTPRRGRGADDGASRS